MIKSRSIVSYILLTIVTAGIYGFYWIYQIQKDLNIVCEDGNDTSPGLALVLWLVTCGIYPLVWQYIQGERMKTAGNVKGIPIQESGSTYLLWSILGSLLCGLGPLIAMAKFIKNFNALATVYNQKIINTASQV